MLDREMERRCFLGEKTEVEIALGPDRPGGLILPNYLVF
jgi:hypothetical protein